MFPTLYMFWSCITYVLKLLCAAICRIKSKTWTEEDWNSSLTYYLCVASSWTLILTKMAITYFLNMWTSSSSQPTTGQRPPLREPLGQLPACHHTVISTQKPVLPISYRLFDRYTTPLLLQPADYISNIKALIFWRKLLLLMSCPQRNSDHSSLREFKLVD